jgi:hypothetical protein
MELTGWSAARFAPKPRMFSPLLISRILCGILVLDHASALGASFSGAGAAGAATTRRDANMGVSMYYVSEITD